MLDSSAELGYCASATIRSPSAKASLAARTRWSRRHESLSSFAEWLGEEPDVEDGWPEVAAAIMEDFFSVSDDNGIPLDPTALDVNVVEEFTEALSGIAAEDADPVVDALHSYLHFLEDTDRWSGDVQDLVACLERVHDFVEGVEVGDIVEQIAGPVDAISEDTRRADIEKTVIVQAVPDLLQWLGRSRQITPSRLPRLADIGVLAAMLGLRVFGRRQRPDPAVPTLGFDLPGGEGTDGAPVVADGGTEPVYVQSAREPREILQAHPHTPSSPETSPPPWRTSPTSGPRRRWTDSAGWG